MFLWQVNIKLYDLLSVIFFLLSVNVHLSQNIKDVFHFIDLWEI